MPIIDRLPFWVFALLGLTLITMASIQYLSFDGTLTRNSISFQSDSEPPELIRLGQFNSETDIRKDGDVYVMGQLEPFDVHVTEHPDLGEIAYHKFYSAEAQSGSKVVNAVILAPENESFMRWLNENVAGNASMGNMYAVHAKVTFDRKIVAPVIDWLSTLRVRTPEHFVVLVPYSNGVYIAPGVSTGQKLMSVLIMVFGGGLLLLAYNRWEKKRIHDLEDPHEGSSFVDAYPETLET